MRLAPLEDRGNPAPPNTYLRWVSAMPDGRILCYFMMVKPTTLLFDPAKREFEPVPRQLEGIQSGVSWNGYFLAGSSVFDGKSLEPVTAPFPTPRGAWAVNLQLTSDDVLFLQQGRAIYRFAKGDKTLTPICDTISAAGLSMARPGRASFSARAGRTTLSSSRATSRCVSCQSPLRPARGPCCFLTPTPPAACGRTLSGADAFLDGSEDEEVHQHRQGLRLHRRSLRPAGISRRTRRVRSWSSIRLSPGTSGETRTPGC